MREAISSSPLPLAGKGCGKAWRALAVLPLCLLAACQTAPQGYIQMHANQDALNAAQHIANMAGTCWFNDGNSRFADYSYAPELSSSERPRVLVVDKADPGGLPKLVIEVRRAKRGSDIRLFGPLMDGEGERIRSEVSFWAGGGRTCR